MFKYFNIDHNKSLETLVISEKIDFWYGSGRGYSIRLILKIIFYRLRSAVAL
jgi:hypothetical protein